MQWLIKKLFILFGLDIRSLALLRIGTAILIIGECIHRVGDVFVFNSDAGILPRTVLIDTFNNPWHISLNMISGLWQVQMLLVVLSFLFACAMLVGWHTRIATFASWLLLISFQTRNPLILQNSDTVLRMILFWGLFLPLGASASIDSLYRRTYTKLSATILTPATFAFIFQIMMIYVFSAMFKTGPEWLTERSAVYFALNAGGFVTPIGVWLSQYSALLPYLTRGVLLFETWMPIFFFVPFRIQTVRTILLLLAIGMHFAMGLTLELGLFSWVMIVAFLGLLPGGVWDTIERVWRRHHKDCTLYFDAHCDFCNHTASLISTFLFVPGLPVLPAQKNDEVMKYMEQKDSWVFVCNGIKYSKSKAFFMLAKHSPLFGLAAWLLDRAWLRSISDRVYDWISGRRKKMCLNKTIIFPVSRRTRIVGIFAQIVVCVCFLYVVIWNISTLPASTIRIPASLQWVAQAFRFDQKWDMFSPYPLKETGWFVIPGMLVSGQKVDVYTGGLISFEPPVLASRTYKNYRWRKYLMNLVDIRYGQYRLYYGRYLCRQWNTGKDSERLLASFDIIYVRQITLPDGKKGAVDQIPLWHHRCF